MRRLQSCARRWRRRVRRPRRSLVSAHQKELKQGLSEAVAKVKSETKRADEAEVARQQYNLQLTHLKAELKAAEAAVKVAKAEEVALRQVMEKKKVLMEEVGRTAAEVGRRQVEAAEEVRDGNDEELGALPALQSLPIGTWQRLLR